MGPRPGRPAVLRRLQLRLVLGHLPAAVRLPRGLRVAARHPARQGPAPAPGPHPPQPDAPAGLRRRRPRGGRPEPRGGRGQSPGVAAQAPLPRGAAPRGRRRVRGRRARIPARDRQHPVPRLADRRARVHGLRRHDQVRRAEDHRGGRGLRQQPRGLRLLHPRHLLQRGRPPAVLPHPRLLRRRVRPRVRDPLRPAAGLHRRHGRPRGLRRRAPAPDPQGQPAAGHRRRARLPRGQRLRARGDHPRRRRGRGLPGPRGHPRVRPELRLAGHHQGPRRAAGPAGLRRLLPALGGGGREGRRVLRGPRAAQPGAAAELVLRGPRPGHRPPAERVRAGHRIPHRAQQPHQRERRHRAQPGPDVRAARGQGLHQLRRRPPLRRPGHPLRPGQVGRRRVRRHRPARPGDQSVRPPPPRVGACPHRRRRPHPRGVRAARPRRGVRSPRGARGPARRHGEVVAHRRRHRDGRRRRGRCRPPVHPAGPADARSGD